MELHYAMEYSKYHTLFICFLLSTHVSFAINSEFRNINLDLYNSTSFGDSNKPKDLLTDIVQALEIFGGKSIIKDVIIKLLPALTIFNPEEYPDIPSIIDTYKCALENEDRYLNITGLLNKYGYETEEHEVKTSDGYLLTMFRVPRTGPAVLVMHGGLSSSDDFVTLGPQAGLAYVLADAGYDVWLGNARGNRHSNRHTILSPNLAEFWDFSFDEIARYDVAAMIDHILNKTNNNQIKLVGHSHGTTESLILCSERPEYNDKISVIALLSPGAQSSNTKSPVFKLLGGPWSPALFSFAESIGIYSFFPTPEIVTTLSTIFCGTPELAAAYCNTIFAAALGPDSGQMNMTSLPVIYSHLPSGSSLKHIKHAAQFISTGKFAKYSYGTRINLQKYGSPTPPLYPLEKVTTKVALFHADNDWFCVNKDLEEIKKRLPNVIETYKVPSDSFSHLDFLFAADVKTLLYNKLLEIFDSN